MLDKKVDEVLEKSNHNYLFLIMAKKEVERLRKLPKVIKDNFSKKITEMAIEHVANNNFPDYSLEALEKSPDKENE